MSIRESGVKRYPTTVSVNGLLAGHASAPRKTVLQIALVSQSGSEDGPAVLAGPMAGEGRLLPRTPGSRIRASHPYGGPQQDYSKQCYSEWFGYPLHRPGGSLSE